MSTTGPGQVRLGTCDDLARLARIELAAGRLFPAGRIPDLEQTYPRHLLEAAVEESLLFVMEAAEEIAGFAVCTRVGGRLHLDEVSVHPDHGRRGHGRALVQHVIETAAVLGLEGVSLTTFADIPWNGPFYESMGFARLPVEDLDEPLTEALAAEAAHGLTERIAMFRAV